MSKSFRKGVPKPVSNKPRSFLDTIIEEKNESQSPPEKVEQKKEVIAETKSQTKKESKKPKQTKPQREVFSVKIDKRLIEQLQDFVWTKRINGYPDYSQRVAIEEALPKLFSTVDAIVKKPRE